MKPIYMGAAWAMLTLCLLLPGKGQAATSDRYHTDQAEVSLLSSSPSVVPGQALAIGFQQRLAPGWHSYWINPGETGAPTQLEWTLPHGTTAGPLQWPMPSRFLIGPVVNHGYEGDVTLLTDMTVPQQLPIGGTWTVSVHARWLVCQEQCIPQQATLSLSLPVGPSAPNTPVPTAIQEARRQLPRPLTSTALQDVGGGKLKIGRASCRERV